MLLLEPLPSGFFERFAGSLLQSLPFLSALQFSPSVCFGFSISPRLLDSVAKDQGEQMQEEDLVELKFRLYDGSDIGPIRYSSSSTVAMLKERIISEWPRDKKIAPKVANDVKLISAGKVLENGTTISQCRSPFGELPAGVITMHVVVQPTLTKTKTEKKVDELPKKKTCSCACSIL